MADGATSAETSGESRLRSIARAIGEPIVEVARTIAGIFEVFGLTIYYIFRGKRRPGAVVAQMYEIGNRSLVFIAVTLGFMGMILVFQAGFQANRITGDLSMLGPLFLQLLFREFAPTITAMMMATRVGTGMAAQIGSMVVTEQVDALRMSAAQPIEYLVVPRFLASMVMMVALVVFACLVAFGSGAVTAHVAFNLNFRTFADPRMVTWFDIGIGLTKAVLYGAAIPVTSCHAGLNVFGGSSGVGRATTQAVVNSSLAVVILDFLVSGVGYVILSLG
jgi:phospholipid/cholesterol/gamma-HCH transport system permease protein